MAKQRSVKFQYRRSKPAALLVILVAIVLSIATLVSVHLITRGTRQRTQALRAEAAVLEQEQDRLEQKLAELGTVQGIIQIAREELDLVEPDSIIFQPEN